jgi:hypothetical protein
LVARTRIQRCHPSVVSNARGLFDAFAVGVAARVALGLALTRRQSPHLDA